MKIVTLKTSRRGEKSFVEERDIKKRERRER